MPTPFLDLLRRRRELRLLVGGQTVSLLGSELTFVALAFQMYELTGSTLAVGLLGVAEFVPILLFALVGGALADSLDRRRLIRLAEAGAAVVAGVLVVNALLDEPQAWVLFACAALMAALTALRRPPLDALMPRLVERDELKAASAAEMFFYETGGVLGPVLAGVLIATAGLPTVYAVDLVTFLASLAALTAMRTPPPPPDAEPPSLRGVVEGFRYARSRQELVGTYLIDINAMFFGIPLALFPAIADRFGGPAVLGLLFAAPAVGVVIFSLTSGWTERVHRHGRAVALAAAGYGLAIIAFDFAGSLWLALVFLALAGGADAISGIFRAVMWNETIPDRLRGRLAGIEMLSWSTGPTLGTAEAGVVASLSSVRTSVVSGGIGCVVGTAVLVALLPRFWRYDSRLQREPG